MGFRVMRTGTSVTVIEEKRGAKSTMFYARDVRGALVWPATPIPGYALIMAQRDFMENGKFALVLLEEISDSKPTHFFKKLFQVAHKLSCRQIYAEILEEANEASVDTFNDYARHHSQISIFLEPAPSRNLEFAFSLLEEWTEADALEVKENTILATQLEQAGQEDLRSAEQTLFAVKALSFLVCSVEREPWSAPNLFPSGGRSRLRSIV